jgi:hypothetical protein
MRDAVLTGENALPKDDLASVTRFRAAAAKRLQAYRTHHWRLGYRRDGTPPTISSKPTADLDCGPVPQV